MLAYYSIRTFHVMVITFLHISHKCCITSEPVMLITCLYSVLRAALLCCAAVGVDGPVECDPTWRHPFKLGWKVKNPK